MYLFKLFSQKRGDIEQALEQLGQLFPFHNHHGASLLVSRLARRDRLGDPKEAGLLDPGPVDPGRHVQDEFEVALEAEDGGNSFLERLRDAVLLVLRDGAVLSCFRKTTK